MTNLTHEVPMLSFSEKMSKTTTDYKQTLYKQLENKSMDKNEHGLLCSSVDFFLRNAANESRFTELMTSLSSACQPIEIEGKIYYGNLNPTLLTTLHVGKIIAEKMGINIQHY